MRALRGCPPILIMGTLVAALLSACSSSPPKPQPAAGAFLAAWSRQDWAAMRKLTDHPPANFASVNQAAFRALSVRQAGFAAGTMRSDGTTASEPITERLSLAGLGTVVISSTLHLVMRQGRWLIAWSPATIAPRLRASDRLV